MLWLVISGVALCIIVLCCTRGYMVKNREIKKLQYKLQRAKTIGQNVAIGESNSMYSKMSGISKVDKIAQEG